MAASPLRRNVLPVFVALLSLTTFAFAQSIYQVIVSYPDLLLNQVTHPDLVLIILCFNLLPAVVLAVVWVVLNRLAPAAADRFLSASFLLLLTPFLAELHLHYLWRVLRFHNSSMLVVITLSVAAWVVFRHRAEFERFLLVLSPVVLIFPALFLWHAWPEVTPTATSPAAAIAAFAAADTGKPHPPIFVLVLDEFTRRALLDNHGNVDASRFPRFAELSRHSTWFNNATANAEYTLRSLPVIVTGNFPQGNDASDRSYPNNLFRLLAPEYDITIHEETTRFCACPQYHCLDASQARQFTHRIKLIAELYLFRIAPKWVVYQLIGADLLRGEQARFRKFISEIGATPGSRPTLEFMHYILPHSPYMLTPDGSIQRGSWSGFAPTFFDPTFAGDAALIQRLRNDYEMQIKFVDRELGKFIDQLKQAGIYDRALIVVTADHGVSWKIDAPGRVLSEANAEMIFPVPLFIKLPGQTEGYVSTEDAQLIDLVPTIAAVAGVTVPWQVAGRNLFAPSCLAREKIMIDEHGKKFVYPPTGIESSRHAQGHAMSR
jgi:hypothetical protein